MNLRLVLPLHPARRCVALAATLGAGLAAPLAAQTASSAGASPAAATVADAAALQQLRATTLALIELLVQQGLLTRERADTLLRQAEAPPPAPANAGAAPLAAFSAAPAPATTTPPRPVQRVPYLSETVRAELREAIKLDVLEQARTEGWADSRQVPEWSRRIRLSGDLRVRAQSELFDRDNLPADEYQLQNQLASTPAWSPDLTNTTVNRHRLTLRARLTADAKLSDDSSAQLRLSTGASTSGSTSSSQTLGNSFNKLSLTLDRAWLRWEPRFDARLMAGRMANPFFGTDLLWPDDLSLDGLAGQGEWTLASGAFAYANVGVFALEEQPLASGDKWLLGLQAGADWTWPSGTQLRVGLGVYDFHGVAGVRESTPAPTGALAATTAYRSTEYPRSLRLKGNTLINLNDPTNTGSAVWGLASRFRPVNLTVALQFKPFADELQMTGSLDWVKNTGFDIEDMARRANDVRVRDVREMTTGVQARLQLGHPRLGERGQWQLFAAMRRFERDAWLDGLTDTNWHGGGTNYQGWSLGAQWAFDRGTTLGLRWTSTRQLDDRVVTTTFPLGTLSGAPLKMDTVQLDLSTRF